MTRVVVGALFAVSVVSVEQEIEIGKQANAQVRKQVPELRDAETAAYVRAIGQRLVPHAAGAKYPYTFAVADYREINAFALPGGPVWVHRGALRTAMGSKFQVPSSRFQVPGSKFQFEVQRSC